MRQQLKTMAALAAPLALFALGTTALRADDHDKKTDVTITEPVQVPGGIVLAPGTYMFILSNSESNRNIVEIKSEDGKHLYAMMFTTRAARTKQTSKTVLTFYEMPAGQPQALRQWYWPGDYDGQEFLYPNSEAAVIGKASNQQVPTVSDEEFSKLNDQGFSTKYPADTTSGNQTVNPGNSNGAPTVNDPGAKGGNQPGLPNSR